MKPQIQNLIALLMVCSGSLAAADTNLGSKPAFRADFTQLLQETAASQKALHREFSKLANMQGADEDDDSMTVQTLPAHRPSATAAAPAPSASPTRGIASMGEARVVDPSTLP